jgi:predicted nucleotidyltransferase
MYHCRQAIAEPSLGQITDSIVAAFSPHRIVLFGSKARGDSRADSDFDLLIEMDTVLSAAERIRAVNRLFTPRTWPLDVVVFTPEEAARQRASRNSLVRTAEREGRILYERPR